APESARVPGGPVAKPGEPPGDRSVVREEQEGEVVADGSRVAPVGVVDAGPTAVDHQGGGGGDQPREAHPGQGQERGCGDPPGEQPAPAQHDRQSLPPVWSITRRAARPRPDAIAGPPVMRRADTATGRAAMSVPDQSGPGSVRDGGPPTI